MHEETKLQVKKSCPVKGRLCPLRYLRIPDRYWQMVDGWTTMQCITHSLLESRAWSSCSERGRVCVQGRGVTLG